MDKESNGFLLIVLLIVSKKDKLATKSTAMYTIRPKRKVEMYIHV